MATRKKQLLLKLLLPKWKHLLRLLPLKWLHLLKLPLKLHLLKQLPLKPLPLKLHLLKPHLLKQPSNLLLAVTQKAGASRLFVFVLTLRASFLLQQALSVSW